MARKGEKGDGDDGLVFEEVEKGEGDGGLVFKEVDDMVSDSEYADDVDEGWDESGDSYHSDDDDYEDWYDATIPLLQAAQEGKRGDVEALLQPLEGENIFARGQHGKKALMIASSEGHLPVVEYLCERGGAVESLVVGPGLVIKWQAASSSKAFLQMLGTALTRASARGHLPVVEYLCERAPQGGGGSLLMAADKEYQRAASAPELALPAADWPVKTPEDGKTALMRASLGGHLPVVEYLCERGGKSLVMAAHENGKTAIDLAGNTAVQKYLEERMAAIKASEK